MRQLLLLIIVTSLFACSNKPKVTKVETKSFKMVEIPVMLTTPAQRAAFLVNHYWDNFDFKDTSYLNLPEVTEQALTNYLSILPEVDKQTANASLQSLIKCAEADTATFSYFKKLTDKYLYDPNSPMRNEDYYLAVLEKLIDSPLTNDAQKSTLIFRRNLAMKNRVGDKAADFVYTLASGAQAKMYNLKADYTLLFFNNPGCHACEEIMEVMKSSQIIGNMLSENKLKVLAFYTDEDLAEWKRYQTNMPSFWINAYDKGTVLKERELYDLKAIPTLYLLDKQKNVLLKDAPFALVQQYLEQSQSSQ